ncbi:hypothetical protein L211DRAFT_143548 [Terfezia boudieri ATCC MYA-4762]|uniref:Uncharacterized protein n=1 Tax=Terfezia boudieri ATCC MYA-4762 TaxID=1051890 RepID=A0A3N4LP68_9PEZI|nr:hypothetical protein L211DRAFT_143548 [Terfezia boudieri ATCC MYA-4762]
MSCWYVKSALHCCRWSTSYLRPRARLALTTFVVPSEVLAADNQGSADASLPHGAIRACPLVGYNPLIKSANPRRGYHLLVRRTYTLRT